MPTHVLPELARPQDRPLSTLAQLQLFRENKFQAQTHALTQRGPGAGGSASTGVLSQRTPSLLHLPGKAHRPPRTDEGGTPPLIGTLQ